MQLKDFCELCWRFSLTWTACLKGNTELAPSSAQEKLGASVPRSIGTEPQQVFRSILLFKLTIVCQPKSLYPLSLGSPRPQGQGAVRTARGRSDSPELPDDTFPHQHFQEIGAIRQTCQGAGCHRIAARSCWKTATGWEISPSLPARMTQDKDSPTLQMSPLRTPVSQLCSDQILVQKSRRWGGRAQPQPHESWGGEPFVGKFPQMI